MTRAAKDRERYASDPEYRQKRLDARRRYVEANRAIVRERANKQAREQWSERKVRRLKRHKERFKTDPDYRNRVLASQRRRYQKWITADPARSERHRDKAWTIAIRKQFGGVLPDDQLMDLLILRRNFNRSCRRKQANESV